MKVNTTAGEVVVAGEHLKILLDIRMPAGVGLQVARLAQSLNVEAAVIEKQKGEVVKRYVKPGKDGSFTITPADKNYVQVLKELGTLMSEVIEVEVPEVKLPASISLEPKILLALSKFIAVVD